MSPEMVKKIPRSKQEKGGRIARRRTREKKTSTARVWEGKEGRALHHLKNRKSSVGEGGEKKEGISRKKEKGGKKGGKGFLCLGKKKKNRKTGTPLPSREGKKRKRDIRPMLYLGSEKKKKKKRSRVKGIGSVSLDVCPRKKKRL